ncbi:MAG: hypothetical protein LBJ31_01690 [Treponema sp.]|jgi:hypothetical protein|nr:hypothetical protein [Treponema sp.]
MDVDILYSQSAFKHGCTEADIRHAFKTRKYDSIIEDGPLIDKNLLIGFDRNANLIEILYNVIDDDTVKVFHAMKCPDKFLALLNNGSNYA